MYKHLPTNIFLYDLICHFFKNYNVDLKTIERYILFLRNKKFIFYEGYFKSGKYQVTEKYKKSKKSIK